MQKIKLLLDELILQSLGCVGADGLEKPILQCGVCVCVCVCVYVCVCLCFQVVSIRGWVHALAILWLTCAEEKPIP